jgi:6-pyruvoyl-tetrahydropterin synthase
MVYVVSRKFKADFAHRVYNQSTDGTFKPKCKNVHGHTYEFEVFFTCNELIDDMVIDFNYLKSLQRFLDDFFDHRFVVSIDDEELLHMFNTLMQMYGNGQFEGYNETYDNIVSLSKAGLSKIFENELVIKFHHNNPVLNSLTIIPTNSTSECLAKLIYNICQFLFEDFNIKVTKVIVRETSKSKAIYEVDC